MSNSRIPSPARSQGAPVTPRRYRPRGPRSVGSPARSNASGRLTSLVQQFKDNNMDSFALSPLRSRSILSDNTDIEEPRRKSWWKKLDENSRDVLEVLDKDNKIENAENVEELMDIEVLSQEKKNYTMDLPESSDGESISSIVIPQRKLFTQKDNAPQKKFGKLIGNRESLAKLNKTNVQGHDKTVNVGTKTLFNQAKPRSNPIFPAALLNLSPNKTMANKTKELVSAEPKAQARNLFGNRPGSKRKNMFADFIASESEDEIPGIEAKIFAFQKKPDQPQCHSSVSGGAQEASSTSNITIDLEGDDWNHLPSSTMVDNQIEYMNGPETPVKRRRLSKLSEGERSEDEADIIINTNNNTKDNRFSARKSKGIVKEKSVIIDETINQKSTEIKEIPDQRTTKHISKEHHLNTTKNKVNKTTEIENIDIEGNNQNYQGKEMRNDNTKADVIQKDPSESEISKRKSRIYKSKSLTTQVNVEESEENVGKENKSMDSANHETDGEEQVVDGNLGYNDNEQIEEAVENIKMQEVAEDKLKIKHVKKVEVQNQDIKKKTQEEDKEQKLNQDMESNDQEMEDENLEGDKEMENTDQEMEDENQGEGEKSEEVEGQKSEVEIDEEEEHEEQADDEVVEDVSELVEEENEDHEVENESQEMEEEKDNHKVEIESQEVEEEENDQEVVNESQEVEEEEDDQEVVDESQEVEVENKDQEVENDNQEVEDEEDDQEVVNESHEVEEEEDNQEVENESQEVEAEDEEVENENQEMEEEDEDLESDEVESEEAKDEEEDQEVEDEVEVVENVEQSGADESQEVNDDEQEEEEEDDQEAENNQTQDDQNSENFEMESEHSSPEEVEMMPDDEVDGNESEEVQNETVLESSQEQQDSKVTEASRDNEDDSQEIQSPCKHNEHESEEEQENELEDEDQENNALQYEEDIEETENDSNTPNISHDTTGRNRRKDTSPKSPEAILHNARNQADSFIAQGRNTSVRKTKSMIRDLNVKPSLAPLRESTGISDGTRDSSAEGSGWDSHRTTRKTIRQTFGRDFTPRKSLRALVMEKSAKRQTMNDMNAETTKVPLANSTKYPDSLYHQDDDETIEESDHEASKRLRQTTLEMYLQKIKKQNMERQIKMEQAIRDSLKTSKKDTVSYFKVPSKPISLRRANTKSIQKPKNKQTESSVFLDQLPPEIIEDMKYKPPKRFQPSNASWITKRLYKFLEIKLEPKYDYKARVRAEKLVETIYNFAKDTRRHEIAPSDAVETLKHEMARLDVVKTHFEFYEFFHEYMPREIRVKVVPDVVNNISLPKHGVFSEILR